MPPEDPRVALTRQWLAKARRDLLMADRAATVQPPLLDMAAFHWQQVAEKALKGYRTWPNQCFRRTHELLDLLARCMSVEADCAVLQGAATRLTPYVTEFRYPGVDAEPTSEDAAQARQLAQAVFDHVLAHLPAEVAPDL